MINATPPSCLHCGRPARLTNGREVYPRRPDLAGKPIWKCDDCSAHCGCHRGGTEPLGHPADKATRMARLHLHNQRLDPLWRSAPKKKRQASRREVYEFLALKMGLPLEKTHTGMWSVEQCREAWRHLHCVTLHDVRLALREASGAEA